MSAFTIKRSDILRYGACKRGIDVFDQVVQDQGLGGTDLVLADGWTELHSVYMYQVYPDFHQWLMQKGFIPPDNVASKFPPITLKATYANFPNPNLDPSLTFGTG
jgi:hypothetical protein